MRLAEDIDFKFPMKKACTKEIAQFCKDIPHGHARIISCLQVRAASAQHGVFSDVRVANRTKRDFRVGAHAVTRHPPNPSNTIVARTEGYTYAAKVWAPSLVQAIFLSRRAKP